MTIKEFTKKYFVDRRGTDCCKWDGLKNQFGEDNLISMWVADTDFQVPGAVLEALEQRVKHGAFGYPLTPPSYLDSFIAWEQERHNFHVEKDWVRYTPGIVTGLYWCIQAYTKENDAIIVNTPVYYPFQNAVKDLNRKLICNDLINTDGYYTIDYDTFEKQIVENDVKLYILCSPHNPVGRVWKESELEQVFRICASHGVLIISDEIHQDLVLGDHRHHPACGVAGGKYSDQIILMTSTSKTFNLAGLKNSYTVIPSEKYRKIFDAFNVFPHVDMGCLFGYIAADAAYRYGAEWLDQLLDVIRENYQSLCEAFSKALPLVKISPLEGTYLAWIDLRAYIKPEDTKNVVQGKARVAVDYGEWFSQSCKGFVRMNLGTSRQLVDQASAAIIKAIQEQGNCRDSK